MTIRTIVLALPLLVLGWLAVLVGVGLFSDAAPGAVVLFPSARLTQGLPDAFRVLSATSFSVTISSDTPGLTHALYAHGAWIVLPAGLPGCLPLPATATR